MVVSRRRTGLDATPRQHRLDAVGCVTNIVVLPDAQNDPIGRHKLGLVATVPRDIAIELCLPVARIGPGLRPVVWAAMPKAAINEDRQSGGCEHHIDPAPHAGSWGHQTLAEPQATPVEPDRNATSGRVSVPRLPRMTARTAADDGGGAGGIAGATRCPVPDSSILAVVCGRISGRKCSGIKASTPRRRPAWRVSSIAPVSRSHPSSLRRRSLTQPQAQSSEPSACRRTCRPQASR